MCNVPVYTFTGTGYPVQYASRLEVSQPEAGRARRLSLVLVRAPNRRAATRVEMSKILRRKSTATPVAPTSLAPATDSPADKKSDQPQDSGPKVDSNSRSPPGKWPSKAFVLFRLLLALPGPMFLLFTGTHEVRENRNRRSLNVSLVIPLVPLQD